MRRTIPSAACCVCVLVLSLTSRPVAAQPSGGPYGPIPTTYAVPTAAHVYYVAPDGKADAPGTALGEPTTIEAAISRVVTGDAIVMRGGTYRTGGLTLNQGITLQPYGDERAGPQGHARRGEVGSAAQQHLAHEVGQALPGQAARLVAAPPRGHANADAPLQQRHGVRRRRAAAVRGLGRRARRPLVLHRLRRRLRLHRHRTRPASSSRSRRTTSPCCARRGPPTARSPTRRDRSSAASRSRSTPTGPSTSRASGRPR